MQNADTDINSDATPNMVSVRDSVTRMREAQTLNSALTTIDEMAVQARKSGPACSLPNKLMPVNNTFFAQQQDVRAPFRGEAIPLKGAESVVKPASKHTPEFVAFMKANSGTTLPMHIKADPVNGAMDARYNLQDLKANELRTRVMMARQQQLLNYENSTAIPSALARPLSINCKDAEREKSAATYTQGNEEAYRFVDLHNAKVTGFTDTAATGAQKVADEFNAKERQMTVARQTQQPKWMIGIPQGDSGEHVH